LVTYWLKASVNTVLGNYKKEFFLYFRKERFFMTPTILPERFNDEILTRIEPKIEKFSETSHLDRTFLNGLICQLEPKKILEIGVSAGGSSVVILNAIQSIENAKLYSVDIQRNWYRNQKKPTGWAVMEHYPELLSNNKWELITDVDICGIIENISSHGTENFDFAFIDSSSSCTKRTHPSSKTI
jgi:predicted O-methyltransferase YrrM